MPYNYSLQLLQIFSILSFSDFSNGIHRNTSSKVISSAYSKSSPTEIPLAIVEVVIL